jgi:hypothetical protein
MAQPISRAGAVLQDFPGLVTNLGPDAPGNAPGAAEEQLNLACLKPGEVRVRGGLREVEYED